MQNKIGSCKEVFIGCFKYLVVTVIVLAIMVGCVVAEVVVP